MSSPKSYTQVRSEVSSNANQKSIDTSVVKLDPKHLFSSAQRMKVVKAIRAAESIGHHHTDHDHTRSRTPAHEDKANKSVLTSPGSPHYNFNSPNSAAHFPMHHEPHTPSRHHNADMDEADHSTYIATTMSMTHHEVGAVSTETKSQLMKLMIKKTKHYYENKSSGHPPHAYHGNHRLRLLSMQSSDEENNIIESNSSFLSKNNSGMNITR